jgi:YfiH family protein
MIRPEGFRGAAFGTAADGDARHDAASRIAMAERLGIPTEWATIHQVHGPTVLRVAGPGFAGDADGLITETPGVPLVVATADCVPVIVEGGHTTAVVHAGWRGVAARVLERAVEVMVSTGDRPLRVAIGPAIGPCCYEVGAEVVAAIDGFTGTTTWGTRSVDLRAALAEQAGDVEVWRSERCTYTDETLHSYRENATTARQVAVTWFPSD